MPRNVYPTIMSIPRHRSRVYYADGEGRICIRRNGRYLWYSWDREANGYVMSGSSRRPRGATSRPIPVEE